MQFTDTVNMAERIEQGIRNGRISIPNKNRGFEGKKKDVNHIECGYRAKKNHFQNYSSPNPSSWIANINFNSHFLVKKTETKSNQVNNQAENRPRKNYEITQEQLSLL